MTTLTQLKTDLQTTFGDSLIACDLAFHEITIHVAKADLLAVSKKLRDLAIFKFTQLIDVCGVDYLQYGQAEWQTETATSSGFERGVARDDKIQYTENPYPERFAVVYHLLSIDNNQRLRMKVYLAEDDLRVPSVNLIWNSANWFEREAFDLFGILFEGHPDLRRILTDYGFVGHPFRKDFPLIGHVEMRYDAAQQRVVYEPVSIKPRTLVPRTIRNDGRYVTQDKIASEQQR